MDFSYKTQVSPETLEKIKTFKQTHLLEVLPLIKDSKELDEYINTIESIDYALLEQLLPLAYRPNENLPIDPVKDVLSLKNLSVEKRKELADKGLEIISKGQAAVLLMGGGQGSRLGFEHPKGLYNIQLPSQKAIYQIHAEKLLRMMKLAKAKFPQNIQGDERDCLTWFIMTSKGKNHEETSAFFEKNNYFGLKKERVILFPQGALPAIDQNGKVLLENYNKVFMAPNGNGAVYEALNVHGCLKKMLTEGIKLIHIIGVDNVLAKLCDPLFIGFAALEGKPVSCKYVQKKNWSEKVGVHVLKGGKPSIVEYSEISEEQAKLTDENNQLKFFSSAIVNMIFTVDFINSIITNPEKTKELNSHYHVAKKKIKYFDAEKKEIVNPTDINGFKYELFVFDTYPLAGEFSLLEVIREEEFAPVKNPPGTPEDSPDCARGLISQLHQSWLEKLGVQFSKKASSDLNCLCEIDPLISYDGEGLEEYAEKLKGKVVELPFYLKKE